MTDTELGSRPPESEPLPPPGGKLTLVFLAVIVIGIGVGLAVRAAFRNADQLREAQTLAESLAELPAGPQAGSPAPDFTLEMLDFTTFSLSEHLATDGRPVVLNFWAPSCPPCRAEAPEFIRTAASVPDVLFVGVGTPTLQFPDTREDAVEFVNEFGINYPVGWDETETIAATYGIIGLPQTWVIDSDGIVVRVFIGAVTQEWLEGLLAQDLGITP